MMNGFWYQVKLTVKDKMSVLSFLLPLAMAVGVNLLNTGGTSSWEAYRFAYLEAEADEFGVLSDYGIVRECWSKQELIEIVNNPSDDTIGLLTDGDKITLVLSGDERTDTLSVSSVLPAIVSGEIPEYTAVYGHQTRPDLTFGNMLISMTVLTALFLGLVFNSMNIVTEKEDGIVYVNDVLPISPYRYLVQKITIGYFGSVLLSLLTALICIRTPAAVMRLLPLLTLGGFTVSLLGLFLGKLSSSLINALVYVKAAMLLFMAVPVVVYLFAPAAVARFFHLFPAYTVFSGIMDILEANAVSWPTIVLLAGHGVLISSIYLFCRKKA